MLLLRNIFINSGVLIVCKKLLFSQAAKCFYAQAVNSNEEEEMDNNCVTIERLLIVSREDVDGMFLGISILSPECSGVQNHCLRGAVRQGCVAIRSSANLC
jgi:hypothetical protein